jgi:hypothetical protein
VRYYEDVLVPGLLEDEEPLHAWIEYGRKLGELSSPGRTTAIDAGGRASPYRMPAGPDQLVLHLPDDANTAALALCVPEELSPAQAANYALLIERARELR